jgi:hypothetical protein
MFRQSLSGLRQAYPILDAGLDDSICSGNRELIFLHAVTRTAMLFIDNNDVSVTDSFLKLAEEFGVAVMGDSFDPCDINPIDFNVPLDMNTFYRVPDGAPNAVETREIIDYSIIPEINEIIAELESIGDSPGDRFRIFLEPYETGLLNNLEVDFGEVLILKGLLLGFKGVLESQLAHDMAVDVNEMLLDKLLHEDGIDVNDGNSAQFSALIDVNDPNNPNINEDFLTPYPDLLKVLPTPSHPDAGDGAAILAQAKSDWARAIDYYFEGLNYILSENASGTDPQDDELVYVDPNDQLALHSLNQKLTTLRDSLQNDTVGRYSVETTKTYELYDANDDHIGQLRLVYNLTGLEGGRGSLTFDGNAVPSPWEVDWFSIEDANQLEVGLEHLSDTEWRWGFLYAILSEDGNSLHAGSFDYWGSSGSGNLFDLSGQLADVNVGYLELDLNPLFGDVNETARYPDPLDPRDLLPQFDRQGVPISGTVGHGLGDDATLGGILPGMTQEIWAILLDLPVPGLRFQGLARLSVGDSPLAVALGDVNGDGILDIVTANADSNDVSVLLGLGDGTFHLQALFDVGAQPECLALGDLNGDGILDIVTGNSSSNSISVLLGLGAGSFQSESQFAVGAHPASVALADLNDDGILDAVTANSGSANVSVLLGRGDGSFQTQATFAAGEGPLSVALADLNGDGALDIVTADSWANTVSVLLGLGDGSFLPRTAFGVGFGPHSVALGDLNFDGVTDIVAANFWSEDVSVLLGVGDGSFQTESRFDAGQSPRSLSLGDVNGDGVPDIVTANGWDESISVLLGIGDGGFERRSIFDVGNDPQSVAVGDLNGDGVLDIVTSNTGPSDVAVFANRSIVFGHSPSGMTAAPVDAIRISFPHDMDPCSFSIEDDVARFVGPRGSISADSYEWLNARTLEIVFEPQFAYGEYELVVGPNILDALGRAMDVDHDSVPAEIPDDRYVATFSLPGQGDLVVTAVEVQGTALAGRTLHVGWDVLNDDANSTISGGFLDAVYLSSDMQWDIDDIYLASVWHEEPVGPQQSIHAEADIVVPGVLPGDYYVLVRTDPGNQVGEPDGEDNNVTASDSIAVDVQELIIGTAATEDFSDVEPARYFRVTVAENEDLRIHLDDLDDEGTNELYASLGTIPTRSQFDYRYPTNFAPDQAVHIPGTQAGTYYIFAYGSSIPDTGPSTFSIKAEYLPMEIYSVDPNKGWNASPFAIAVTISGSRFREGAAVLLRREGQADVNSVETTFVDTATMLATFDLSGVAAGSWDLLVINPDLETVSSSFAVAEGGSGRLETRLILPSALAANRRAVLWIEYTNVGWGPMLAPLLKLHGSQNALLTVDPSLDGRGLRTYDPPPGLTDTVQVLALGSGPDVGVLNPGDSGQIPVYYRGLTFPLDWSLPPIEFDLGILTADNSTPIDWAEVESQMCPCHEDPNVWDEAFLQLQAQIGTTWGDYVAALADNARIRARYGVITYSVRELFRDEIQRALGADQGIIAGHVHLIGGGDAIGANVLASQVDGNDVAVAVTNQSGHFFMGNLTPGSYEVTVEDHFLDSLVQLDVAEEQDPCAVELAVRGGGAISGNVRDQYYYRSLYGALITAVNTATGHTFAVRKDWGYYSINGLPEGTYTVRCELDPYVTAEKTDVSVELGQTTWLSDFFLTVGGTIQGTITDANSGSPVEGAQVVATSANSMPITAMTDGSGHYTLRGMAGGEWSLRADHAIYLPSGVVTITLMSGETKTQDFVLDLGVSAEGFLTDSSSGAPVAGAAVYLFAGEAFAGFGNTNEQGQVTVRGLGQETFTVVVSAPGRARGWFAVDTTGGNAQFDAELENEATISGTVTLSDGSSPHTLNAFATLRGGMPFSEFAADTNNGNFRLSELAAGTYDIVVIGDDLVHLIDDVLLASGDDLDLGEIVLSTSADIQVASVQASTSQQSLLAADSDLSSQLDAAERFVRRYWLPTAYGLFGTTVRNLWDTFISTSSASPSGVRPFYDGHEIVEGNWHPFGTGFRDSWITQFNLHFRVRQQAVAKIRSRLSSRDGYCELFGGESGELTIPIQTLLGREVLERPLNYSLPGDIPWNIAGGVGYRTCLCPHSCGGSCGQAYDDRRKVTGNVIVRTAGETSVEVSFDLRFTVQDTIDFVPGDLGAIAERIITKKLKLLEEHDRAYDVPYLVSFSPELEPTGFSVSQFDCEPPDPNTDPNSGGDANNIGSWDPNKKIGPKGFGLGGFLVADPASLAYTVYFENEPNATAAALGVRIEDELDTDLDWTTFELLEIGFGPHQVTIPPGMTHYETSNEIQGWTWNVAQGWHTGETPLKVDIEADIDIATGLVTWDIVSYDPRTGWEPEDAYAGFLPPDDQNDVTHRGEGYVSYRIRPKAGLPTGTQIINDANIIFDVNPPIATPVTLNTIDAGAPGSNVLPLPVTTTETEFPLEWTGQDDAGGSGISGYDIYVSTDGGEFTLWLDGTSDTSASFTGAAGRTFAFYSVATDNVGHVEPFPAEPDAVTTVLGNRPPEANAGPDQTVERTSQQGAEVQLDGSDANDPDDDALTYEWSWPGGSAVGVNPVVTLAPGLTTITLTVSDGQLSDDDTVDINVVDTTSPEVTIIVPDVNQALQDSVTLTAEANDVSGLAEVYFYIRQPNDGNGVPIGYEDLPATLNTDTGEWEYLFDTTQLPDGYYVVLAKAADTYSNEGWSEPVPFSISIRNWAVVELLPASRKYRAGRTMPVKFSLRIAEAVDPAMPFVHNEQLEIRINVARSLFMTCVYGDTARDYRISAAEELYIANCKTKRRPATYVVEIWRPGNNFMVGSFTFETVR